MENLKVFLARQLNDHIESQRGVRQPTYYTWNEQHIADAIEVASAFLFNLIPQNFAEIKEYTLTEEDCVITFCAECGKFLGLIDIEVDGSRCFDLIEVDDGESNSLLSMLSIGCNTGTDSDEEKESYSYQVLDSSNCAVKFEDPLPKGTVIRYSCAVKPDDFESGDYDEYIPIIAEYAAFWLFRTDSESKSSLERAQMHFDAFKFLVQTQLLIELSNQDSTDDYIYGQKAS